MGGRGYTLSTILCSLEQFLNNFWTISIFFASKVFFSFSFPFLCSNFYSILIYSLLFLQNPKNLKTFQIKFLSVSLYHPLHYCSFSRKSIFSPLSLSRYPHPQVVTKEENQYTFDSSLIMRNVTVEDAGKYKVTARYLKVISRHSEFVYVLTFD